MIEYLALFLLIVYLLASLAEMNHLIKDKEALYDLYEKGKKIDDDLRQAYQDQLQNYKEYAMLLNQQLIDYQDYNRALIIKINQLEGTNETV